VRRSTGRRGGRRRLTLKDKTPLNTLNQCSIAYIYCNIHVVIPVYKSVYCISFSKGVSPLHCAVSNGKLEIVQLLLEAKALVNVKGQKSDRTPLFMAGEVGDIESAKLLLQYGANLNLTDTYGE